MVYYYKVCNDEKGREVQCMKNRVKISVDGKNFTLVGEETEEHMRQVAAYIDEKIAEVREKSVAVTLDSSLAYVLTSINVGDDYLKEKAHAAELRGRLIGMEARVDALMAKLEEAEQAKKEAEELLKEYEALLEEESKPTQQGNSASLQKNKK